MHERPIERARQVYTTEFCPRSFDEDLQYHLDNGYVYSDDRIFVMGRPVLRGAPYAIVTNPAYYFDEPDTWLIYLAAGDLRLLPRLLPYPLPYVAWERENVLRYYKLNQVIKLCTSKFTQR